MLGVGAVSAARPLYSTQPRAPLLGFGVPWPRGGPRGRGAASPPGRSRAELQSPSRCGTSEQGLAVLKSLPVTCNKRDALILHALNACISIFGVFNLLITHFLLIL